MTHDIWMVWKDYCLTKEQLGAFVYSITVRCDWLLHILWFLHLWSGDNATENNDQTYGKDLNVTCWMAHTQTITPLRHMWLLMK